MLKLGISLEVKSAISRQGYSKIGINYKISLNCSILSLIWALILLILFATPEEALLRIDSNIETLGLANYSTIF
jgi:hypothetical protein